MYKNRSNFLRSERLQEIRQFFAYFVSCSDTIAILKENYREQILLGIRMKLFIRINQFKKPTLKNDSNRMTSHLKPTHQTDSSKIEVDFE